MIYDWRTNTETRLPDMPNHVRVSYPMGGSMCLLPLRPSNQYTPKILICGGSKVSDQVDGDQVSSQTPVRVV